MTVSISGALITKTVTIGDNSVTAVLNEEGRATLASLVVVATTGTPNLSISLYDGTTRWYLRLAIAMTTGVAFIFDTPIVVERKVQLEVTSSSSNGDMDVTVTYVGGTAGRPGAQ